MGHCMSYFSLQMFTETFSGLLQRIMLRMSKHFADTVCSFQLTRSALVLTKCLSLLKFFDGVFVYSVG